MGKMKWLPWTGLALAAITSPVFGQLPRSTPTEEVKMVIIKKTIDDQGNEKIEEIEKTGTLLEMKEMEQKFHASEIGTNTVGLTVEIKGLEEMGSERIKSLEQTLDKVAAIEHLDINLTELQASPNTEEMLLLFKEAKNEDRPFLGVVIETTEVGVKITELTSGGAAEAAGLKIGDVIREIQGQPITSIEELQAAIREQKVGESVKIGYVRNHQTAYTNATLKARSNEHYVVRRRVEAETARHHFYRAKSENFDPCKKLEELRGEPFLGVFINLDDAMDGANISSTIEEMGAARAKLQAGDIITKLNGDAVSDYESLRSALKKYRPGQTVRVAYNREGKISTARIMLGSKADIEPRQARSLEELCELQTPAETKSNEPKEEVAELPKITAPAALDVFPNPAEDIVTLQFNGGSAAQATITVMTIDGKEVMRREINENTEQFTQQLDLSKLAAGLYIVTVKQGDTVVSKQVALKSF